MKYTLGFSPCPNDTFIFDALVNNKIDTGNISFEPVLEDVQTLNEWAMQGKLAITKLSYGVLPLVLKTYAVLNSGSALGRGVGPLLIAGKDAVTENIEDYTVAIPGEQTTAHLLFSLAYPKARKKIFLRYDAIEDFVSSGQGLGVIIHENRFTYADKGLKKIVDLGDFWEKETGNAIPLGGIVVKRDIDISIQREIDGLIKKSIEYAFANYPQLNDYIRNNAQEMSEDVMRKHIDLYVNDYSINLGEEGKKTVKKLMDVYQQLNDCTIGYDEIFVS
ncbi:1,4-dihydroxy-6-naphthoate synthase [Ferruginibacter paludis]|uniref:1,4-dihydroxy-6-naphthoate synthase n=1 Tax=Ferruginibacter paludis TaxID=1310417 RepID=UPI0025B2A4F4|nr:1,4-dihydroxy-6-naphthoate synthase [Ferruginibacter paludis]MDN3655044.1 1,4-dihydroxy-6-naphthoate synthase [Ferruginibacter paludis]